MTVAVPSQKAFVDALVRAGFVSANDLNNNIKSITIVVDHKDVKVTIDRTADESLTAALAEFEGGQ